MGEAARKKADNTCQNAVFYICDHRNKYNQKDNPHRKEKKQVFCICFTGIPVSGIAPSFFCLRNPGQKPEIVNFFHTALLLSEYISVQTFKCFLHPGKRQGKVHDG